MLRTLIVDDERIERRGLQMLLERLQLPTQSEEACNGEEALKKLKAAHFDIVLTDISMPFMDGLELIHEIHLLDKELPVIIFTAYADFEKAKRAIDDNAFAYLLKPVNVVEFKAVMQRAIQYVRDCQKDQVQRKQLEEQLRQYKEQLLAASPDNIPMPQVAERAAVHAALGLTEAPEKGTNNSLAVQRALEMIREEYMNDLNLRMVSERVFLSPSYFSSLFTREVGKPFIRCLNDHRLDIASELLLESNMPIHQIASRVGFPGDSYFIAKFKERFHCTPQQYRETKKRL